MDGRPAGQARPGGLPGIHTMGRLKQGQLVGLRQAGEHPQVPKGLDHRAVGAAAGPEVLYGEIGTGLAGLGHCICGGFPHPGDGGEGRPQLPVLNAKVPGVAFIKIHRQ